jgi:hypothetical protein
MRRILIIVASATFIVSAPALLDRAFPAGGAALLAPLMPGLYGAALLERAGLIEAMDSAGDFTLAAAVVMYVVSFAVWVGVASVGIAGFTRARRARVV